MITVGMNYKVIEGKNEAFESMFAKVMEVMNDMEGHGESHLYVDVSAPNDYLIVSQWSSNEAYDGFIASEKFKNVTTWGKEKILAGRPKHEVYGRGDAAPESCPAH